MKTAVSHTQVDMAVFTLAQSIKRHLGAGGLRLYPIPRGGVPVAYMLMARLGILGINACLVDTPEEADVLVDDIVDSGRTAMRWPRIPFATAFCKQAAEGNDLLVNRPAPIFVGKVTTDDTWLAFPWETVEEGNGEDIVVRMLQRIGENPSREGLRETPARVIKAWDEMFDGYRTDIASLFKTFCDGAERVDEMIIVKDIPVESHCEHHLAPFTGKAHIGYIPGAKGIVGLSKLARVVRAFSHRLQVQERLTNQIADAICEYLDPVGVGVIVEAEHTCMCRRGVRVQGTATITSAMRGAMKNIGLARQEFLTLVK